MSISTPVVVTRNGVQISLVMGHPAQLMPMQLTLNTSAAVLLDGGYYLPAASSSSTFSTATNDPTRFKGYISNSDPGADYSMGSDFFNFGAGPSGSAIATERFLPALLRRDTNSETRALLDNSGGILGVGPGLPQSCPYFTATVPVVVEPQSSLFRSLVGSLGPLTPGTPFDPYSAFGLYLISPDAGWLDVGAFNECVFASNMQFFEQGTQCQWSMRLKNLYMLVDGERTFSAISMIPGVESVVVGFDLSLDGFAAPYKVMQSIISTLTYGANKYAETVFDCQLLQQMRRVLIGNTGIELDSSQFINQTITGPDTLQCSFKFNVDNATRFQNTFTLGKPFFRKYYVGFHYPTNKIGIAKLMSPTGIASYTNCRKAWKPTSTEMSRSSGQPGNPSDWPPPSPSIHSPVTEERALLSRSLIILSVGAVALLLALIVPFVFCRRRNRRAKLEKGKSERPGAIPTSTPVVSTHVPVATFTPPIINPDMPISDVGMEEMVLVPLSVVQSMYSRGPSVPVVPIEPRQGPPTAHHLLIPNQELRQEREMEEIRKASGVGLKLGDGHKDHALNVLDAIAAASSSSATTGQTNGVAAMSSETLNYLDA